MRSNRDVSKITRNTDDLDLEEEDVLPFPFAYLVSFLNFMIDPDG
jgi:hypothetical protein